MLHRALRDHPVHYGKPEQGETKSMREEVQAFTYRGGSWSIGAVGSIFTPAWAWPNFGTASGGGSGRNLFGDGHGIVLSNRIVSR